MRGAEMDFADYPLWLIYVASLAAVIVVIEGGRRFGLLAGARGREDISAIEGAIFGLLALMIGFTFAMALSLFEARRDAVLAEANSIGTTALRARLLPAPRNAECLKLLQDYTQIRLDFAQRSPSSAELATASGRASAIQEDLWRKAKAQAASDNAMVPTGLFIQSLNEMIDDQEKRLTAVGNCVPNVVLVVLYGIAFVASAVAGYASGLDAQRLRLPIYVIGALACTIILLIQILDRPDVGLISQQPMRDTAAFIAAFSD